MSAPRSPVRRSESLFAGGAVVMVLCCAIGPAVLGAAAAGLVGGWLGIACAIVLGATVGLLVLGRRSKDHC